MNNDLFIEILEAINARPNKHAAIFDDGRTLDANSVKHLEHLIAEGLVDGSVKSSGVGGSNFRTRINEVTPAGQEFLRQLYAM